MWTSSLKKKVFAGMDRYYPSILGQVKKLDINDGIVRTMLQLLIR